MKFTIKHKFWVFLVCLPVLGLGSLQAQRTVTQADVNNLNTADVVIDAGNDDIRVEAITLQNNSNTPRTLTIKTTGSVTVAGNINLSGENGDSSILNSITSVQRTGKDGHNLNIETTGGNVTVVGIINVSGGNAAPVSTSMGYLVDRKGGTGGKAGNVVIKSANGIEIVSILANGGNGGTANQGEGRASVGAGGNAGNITLETDESVIATGAISANAGNAGIVDANPSGPASNVPDGKAGGNIAITSNNNSINIGGAVSATGGNGAGQEADAIASTPSGMNRGSTDGGTGGTIRISSCGNLNITAAINVNGGLPGTPHNLAKYDQNFNLAGFGGAGGKVALSSSNGDVATTQIQANGQAGSNILGGMIGDGNITISDRAGNGGLGGTVSVSALKGEITTVAITVNGGNGGNHKENGCGGSGNSNGTIDLKAAEGDKNTLFSVSSANPGTKGSNTTSGALPSCTGVNGVAVPDSIKIILQPFTPPTLSGQINVDCDANGVVINKTITKVMLDALLSDYTSMSDEHWEYNNGNGWTALTLPVTVTDANKGEYSAYVRLVYTKCGMKDSLESVLINIPCAPVPPLPPLPPVPPLPPSPQPEIKWPTAIAPEMGNENSIFPPAGIAFENLIVFNQYGITIYQGTGSWNGKWKGNYVDPGTYYYVINLPGGSQRKATIQVVKAK